MTANLASSGYNSTACLNQLCVAYQRRGDANVCAADSVLAATVWAQLNASTAFMGAFRAAYNTSESRCA